MRSARPGFVSSVRGGRSPRHRLLPALGVAAALLPLVSAAAGADSCGPGNGFSGNGSNFNGTPIAGGSFVWFNAVVKVRGVDASAGANLRFLGSTLRFSVGATNYQLDVPDGLIAFSPTAAAASTSFDGTTWTTVVPAGTSQDIFLGGLAFQVPEDGLPGGINPVTWSGTFVSDSPGVTVEWRWAAAVYDSFSTDGSVLGVKSVDGGALSPYHNSDHAGTPESFKPYVTGGARGGGGSNWTGSYSGTQALAACVIQPE